MNKGWRELVKKEEGKTIFVQDIKDFLTEVFKPNITQNYNPFDYPKHYVWEEDGQICSMWTIAPGISTGDAGYEMYCNALKEEAKKYEQSTSTRSS